MLLFTDDPRIILNNNNTSSTSRVFSLSTSGEYPNNHELSSRRVGISGYVPVCTFSVEEPERFVFGSSNNRRQFCLKKTKKNFSIIVVEGEVEMTDLDKNVSELKHKITNLEYDIKDAMEQRYMKFSFMTKDAASLLDSSQSCSNQINNLISRIENQVFGTFVVVDNLDFV